MHYLAQRELCLPKILCGLGFHSRNVWMRSLQARLAWNFLANPSSILNQNMIARYGDNPWNDNIGHKVSKNWNFIQNGVEVWRLIIKWCIREGSSVDMSQDAWILDKPLSSLPTFVNVKQIENQMVEISQMISSTGMFKPSRISLELILPSKLFIFQLATHWWWTNLS